MSSVENTLDEKLQADIEALIDWASKTRPAGQAALIRLAFSRLAASSTEASEQAKLLTLCQALLAMPGATLAPDELIKFLELSVKFATDAGSIEVKSKSTFIAALISLQLGSWIERIPQSVIKQIKSLSSEIEPVAIRSAAAALALRIRAAKSKRDSSLRVSLPSLDISKAVETTEGDLRNDWYKDPWGWPELALLQSQGYEAVQLRLQTRSAGWTLALDVPKQKGGVRPALVLDPVDRVAYQALSDEVSLAATYLLPDWVYGWRLERKSPIKGDYADNSTEWKAYQSTVKQLADSYKHSIRIDVRSFFETIHADRLLSELGRYYRNSAVLKRLEWYFEAWNVRQNGQGLPQRSVASSMLAHVPLQPVDAMLDRYSSQVGGQFQAIRWMDDIWLFGNGLRFLETCVDDISEILDRQGLGLNSEKTLKLEREQALAEIEKHRIIESGDGDPNGEDFLEEIERAVQESDSSRSHWALLASLIEHEPTSAATKAIPTTQDWNFQKLGFAADLIARILRITAQWHDKVGWYCDHANQHVSPESWTSAGWGDMFPTTANDDLKPIADLFADKLQSHTQRILLPLAADRLARWDSSRAKAVLTSVVQTSGDELHAFEARAMLLGLLRAGVSRSEVERVASNFGDESLKRTVSRGQITE